MSHFTRNVFGERVHKLQSIIHWPLDLDSFLLRDGPVGVVFVGQKGRRKFRGEAQTIILAIQDGYVRAYPAEWKKYIAWRERERSRKMGMTFDEVIAPVEKWARGVLAKKEKKGKGKKGGGK